MQIFKGMAAVLLGLSLVACGGGGGSAGTPPFGGGNGGGGEVPAATSVEVVSSSPEVGTAGEQVQITAIVRGAGNVTLASVPVTFAADTGSLSAVSPTTDASGVATARFSAGADKAARTANITVTAGSVTGAIAIDVQGSTVTASGPSTLQFNATAPLSVKVVDSGGAPLPGVAIGVTSALGAGLSASSVATDVQGNATVTYTANRAGSDTVVFSALGSTASLSISVSGEDFAIVSPASGTTVAIGAGQAVTARYLINGAPAAGNFQIRFASTAGTVLPNPGAATGLPLANGQATATVSSTFAGPATVQATLFNSTTGAVLAQASLPIQFIAVTPASLVLQITPTAIGPNPIGTTTRQAQVRATVKDAVGNPVQGAVVNFSKDADPSAGNLSQASATTDSNGQATVQFIAGATPTAADAVVLRGTVAGTGVTGTATMTVNQSALFIGLGTGNQISNAPGTNNTAYLKVWTAYVTDSNGAAVPNQTLTVSVLPTRYRKGSYVLTAVGTTLVYAYGPWDGQALSNDGNLPAGDFISCANEDTDYSGVVTPVKDINANGRLEPGNVISVNSGPNVVTVTTDAQGFATLNLVYAESYASWVEVALKVTATVAGTESSNQAIFWVPGLKDDFTADGGPPAGLVSPFGQRPNCAVAN
jgi:hypothetical protein